MSLHICEFVNDGHKVNVVCILIVLVLVTEREEQNLEFSGQVEELRDHEELVVKFGFVLVVEVVLVVGHVDVDFGDDGNEEVHHDDHDDELVQAPGDPDEADDGVVGDLHFQRVIGVHLSGPGDVVWGLDVANGITISFQNDLNKIRKINIALIRRLTLQGLVEYSKQQYPQR
jgi:hypothetical protein